MLWYLVSLAEIIIKAVVKYDLNQWGWNITVKGKNKVKLQ